jgi:hypothetical protein
MLILPLPGVLSLCDQSTDACVSPDHTCVGPVALSPPSPSQLSLFPLFVLFLLARISDPATKRGATAGPPPAELEVVAVFVLRGVVGWARSSGKVRGAAKHSRRRHPRGRSTPRLAREIRHASLGELHSLPQRRRRAPRGEWWRGSIPVDE